ncbi:MAG: hypothetical protein SOZ51_02360, partial [Eubacteriales bacterium]|nr:hypothetical protein [Eubacteriales bacterium]
LPSAVPVFDICKIDLLFHGFSPSPLSYSYYTTSGAVVQVFNQWFLGGKLARQRLMRGDKSPLSSFGISTPVNPAPLLLIGTFLQPLFPPFRCYPYRKPTRNRNAGRSTRFFLLFAADMSEKHSF